MRSSKRWTSQEHNILVTTIKDSLEKGETLAKSYRVAAFKTGRSVEACKWRWKNIVNAGNSNKNIAMPKTAKVTTLPLRNNSGTTNQQENKTPNTPKQVQVATLADVLDSLFGDALNINQYGFFGIPQTKPTIVKNHDISNLSVYPMAGSANDFAVIDEVTNKAYMVCTLSKDAYFCSCQTNPFSNSTCRHVQKLRTDRPSSTK